MSTQIYLSMQSKHEIRGKEYFGAEARDALTIRNYSLLGVDSLRCTRVDGATPKSSEAERFNSPRIVLLRASESV